METFASRWLLLALLPAIGIAQFVVLDQIQRVAWSFGDLSEYKEFSMLAMFLGASLGALATSLLFACPVARLYGRWSVPAAALICIPTILIMLHYDLGPDRTVLWPVDVVRLLSLTVFGPIAALVASRAFAETYPQQANDGLTKISSLLLLVLLPVLSITLFILHNDFVQATMSDIAIAADGRWWRRATFIVGSVLGPAITASAIAYPIAGLYGRRAALAAGFIAAPTILIRFYDLMGGDGRFPWIDAGRIIHLVSLAVLIPLAAWFMRCWLERPQLVDLSEPPLSGT